MVNYQNKKIVIIGLGLTGLSCLNFFLQRNVVPRIMDISVNPYVLAKLPENIEFYFGDFNDRWLLTADLIIVSPGIALTHPSLQAAGKAGVEIIGDIELFCREAKAPIIAITGSNGKSTVTTLLGEIAKAAGINVGVGGNIGLPALTLLDSDYKLYVLELSSFQLESSFSLHPIAATILNIAEDHMDRYPFGLSQYRATKLRVYEHAKICLFNADDMLTIPIYSNSKKYISFGYKTGYYHINQHKEEQWLQIKGKPVLNVREMKLAGQHNYVNALAALALADILEIPRLISLRILTTFTGLAHRFQLVLERNGVCWINDSKATNVSSTMAALNSLKVNGVLYLLLGGDSKSANLSPLRHYLAAKKNIRLYCFGRDAELLVALSPELAHKTETMEQAMHKIALKLKPGDMVLLSPACSSLDQFKNFEERGNLFIHLAKELSG